MSKLDEIAGKTAVHYSSVSGNREAALDPATILSFIEIITKVVEMLKGCRQNPTTAANTVRNPGLFARIRLRNVVRDSMSRDDFRDHGEQIISALNKTGKDTSVEDLKELLQ